MNNVDISYLMGMLNKMDKNQLSNDELLKIFSEKYKKRQKKHIP